MSVKIGVLLVCLALTQVIYAVKNETEPVEEPEETVIDVVEAEEVETTTTTTETPPASTVKSNETECKYDKALTLIIQLLLKLTKQSEKETPVDTVQDTAPIAEGEELPDLKLIENMAGPLTDNLPGADLLENLPIVGR